jgi:Holliday junction resolvasome RuvABC endonuclease subunit
MNWIGIDPGLDGAIAVMCEGSITLIDTPTVCNGKKRDMDLYTIVRLLKGLSNSQDVMAAIESVHSMPGQGVASTFSFGKGFGMWLGILAALNIPHQAVAPQTWKKVMLADGGKEKDASRVKAMQLYPQIADQLSRKKDHGRADALLIAAWAQRAVYGSNRGATPRSVEDGQIKPDTKTLATFGILATFEDVHIPEDGQHPHI